MEGRRWTSEATSSVSWGGPQAKFRAGLARAVRRTGLRARWRPPASLSRCPRERGVVVLPVERGDRAARLDAPAILERLRGLVGARGLGEDVRVREGCAGDCAQDGPNVSVEILAPLRPGERPNHVAIDWKTYVYSLATLDCLATILEEPLGRGRRVGRRRPVQSQPERLKR